MAGWLTLGPAWAWPDVLGAATACFGLGSSAEHGRCSQPRLQAGGAGMSGQDVWTWIFLTRASSAFGRTMRRTPSFMLASIVLTSTWFERVTDLR